jgi:hypothetical protein
MAFFSLNNLKYLSLKNNSIKVIYDNLFYFNDCEIHMTGNNVSVINENSFRSISTLYLDYSSVISFKDLDYRYFSVQLLYLSNQKIVKLYKKSLKGLYFKIFLDNNLLSSNSFEMDSFGYLPNLIEISFAKNIIKSLDFNETF